MKNLIFAIGLFSVLASPGAMAQSQIVGLVPSSQTTLDLYEEVGASEWKKQATLGDLPLSVLETKAGHHKVRVNGQEYWVKGPQVRVSRTNTAGCTTAKLAPTTQTSSTPGAGKNAC